MVKAVGGGVPDAPRGGQDPSLQTNLKGVRRAACPQAAVPVCGNEKPCQIIVGGGVPDAPRRVKTPPYDAKDKGAAMARPRAGHARPLRGLFPAT